MNKDYEIRALHTNVKNTKRCKLPSGIGGWLYYCSLSVGHRRFSQDVALFFVEMKERILFRVRTVFTDVCSTEFS